MHFAQPWILWGLLATVLPVVLHFLRGRSTESQEWAAFDFLIQAQTQCRTRLRLEELFLLFLRMLVIAAIILTIASPVRNNSDEATNGRTQGVNFCYVIDTSFSMGRLTGSGTPIEVARAYLTRQIESLPVDSVISIFAFSGNECRLLIRRTGEEKDAVRDTVDRVSVTNQSLDLRAAIENLLEQIAVPSDKSFAQTHITLLTDLQTKDWGSLSRTAATSDLKSLLAEVTKVGRTTIIDAADETVSANTRIVGLNVTPNQLLSGETAKVTVAVRNDGMQLAVKRLTILVNGEQRVEREVRIPRGKTLEQTLDLSMPYSGKSVVHAQLSDDELQVDNQRVASLKVIDRVRVLLVGDGGESGATQPADSTDFVEAALQARLSESQSRPIFQTQSIVIGNLPNIDLTEFDCAVLSNIRSINALEVKKLESFVKNGGGVVLGMGAGVNADLWNAMITESATVILPEMLSQMSNEELASQSPLSFMPSETIHPITSPFLGDRQRVLATSPIDAYLMVPEPTSFKTVLRFSNDAPAILEKRVGSGMVVVVTTSLDDSWGYWTYWPSFVPIMTNSVRYASLAREPAIKAEAGGPVSLPETGSASFVTGLRFEKVNDPAAEPISTRLSDVEQRTANAPESVGVYKLNADGWVSPRMIDVNVDPDEGDLTRLSLQTFAEFFDGIPIRIRSLIDGNNVAAVQGPTSKDRTLVSVFLLAVLSLLIAEYVAWRHFLAGAILFGILVVANVAMLLINIA